MSYVTVIGVANLSVDRKVGRAEKKVVNDCDGLCIMQYVPSTGTSDEMVQPKNSILAPSILSRLTSLSENTSRMYRDSIASSTVSF